MAAGDVGHVAGPFFPVAALSAFFDDAGVEGVFPFAELGEEGEGHGFLDLAFLIFSRNGGVALVGGIAFADADDANLGRGFFVEFDLVDDGIEAVVVGAEGLEDLPDDGVLLVVFEGFLRGGVGGDADGEDDVAVLLAGSLAHDAAHRLDDIDNRVARVEEHDGVEGGDIDAFGETAGIGEDAAVVRRRGFLEPVEFVATGDGVHAAIDVVEFNIEEVFFVGVVGFVVIDELGEVVAESLGVSDGAGEGDGGAHGSEAELYDDLVGGGVIELLGEAIPATGDADGVVEVEGVVGVGDKGLEGFGGVGFIDGEDEDLVVGEEVFFDGFAKAEAVEFWAEGVLVVHGAEGGVGVGGFDLGFIAEDLGGGRHVEALGGADLVIQ